MYALNHSEATTSVAAATCAIAGIAVGASLWTTSGVFEREFSGMAESAKGSQKIRTRKLIGAFMVAGAGRTFPSPPAASHPYSKPSGATAKSG